MVGLAALRLGPPYGWISYIRGRLRAMAAAASMRHASCMANYRRSVIPGGTWFFTVVIADRDRPLLTSHVDALRESWRRVCQRHPFTTVAAGPVSAIEEPRQAVVRTATEWQTLWKEHDAQHAAPSLDFTQSIVVAVFLGTRPTAGFIVEITAVKAEGSRAVVEYRERRPPRDALLAEVLTAPFHIVRIARTSGSIEFRSIQ